MPLVATQLVQHTWSGKMDIVFNTRGGDDGDDHHHAPSVVEIIHMILMGVSAQQPLPRVPLRMPLTLSRRGRVQIAFGFLIPRSLHGIRRGISTLRGLLFPDCSVAAFWPRTGSSSCLVKTQS